MQESPLTAMCNWGRDAICLLTVTVANLILGLIFSDVFLSACKGILALNIFDTLPIIHPTMLTACLARYAALHAMFLIQATSITEKVRHAPLKEGFPVRGATRSCSL